MTKSKLVEIFKRLDDEKFSLLKHGVAFEFAIKDKNSGQYMHTGIGVGQDMSQLILYSIVSLYTTLKQIDGFSEEVSIEAFCDSVRELAIKAYKEDIFHLQRIDDTDLGGTFDL